MSALFISVLGTLIAAAVCAEAKAWLPRFIGAITELALRRTPSELQERLREEWQAYLDDTPGLFGRLVAALGFVLAAERLADRTTFVERLQALRFALALCWGLQVVPALRELASGPVTTRFQRANAKLIQNPAPQLAFAITGPVIVGKQRLSAMYTILRGVASALRMAADDMEQVKPGDKHSMIYSVDDAGKVTKSREDNPSESPSSGIGISFRSK